MGILNIERLAVHQFDRIGIVGKNGAWKNRLFKLLANIIQPTRGIVKRDVKSGYFCQMSYRFTNDEIVLELVKKTL